MKKALIVSVVLLFLFACEDSAAYKEIPLDNRSRELVISGQDSIYRLSKSISIYIPDGAFPENQSAILKYLVVDKPADFISNELTTETVEGSFLRTVGMLHFQFTDSIGNELKPRRSITLINNNNDADVKTFHGEGNPLEWKELSATNQNSIHFQSLSRIGGSEYGLRTMYDGDTVLISSFLNVKIRHLSNGDSNCYGSILFEGDPVKGFEFSQIEDPEDKNLLNPILKDSLTSLMQSIRVFPPDYSVLSKQYIMDNVVGILRLVRVDFYPVSNEKLSDIVRGKSYITTFDSGWYNFDIYINSPIASVEITGVDSHKKYALVSQNSDRIIRAKNNKGVIKFDFPIENKTKLMKLISYNDKSLCEMENVLVKQERTVTIRL